MQIRRSFALLLAAVMVLTLVACASKQTADQPSDPGQQAEGSETNNNAPTETKEAEEDNSAKENRILTVYFSADNTKDVDAVSSATPMANGTASVEWIANIIHDTVGGDLVPIIPSADYPLEYNALADYAKKERDDGGRPAFESLSVDPTSYDVVFIGYPIWWYEMPMIMDTLFDTYDFSGVTIVPFNTHAGSRGGGTYGDIKELEPNATVLDGLAVRGEDVGKDSAKEAVLSWLQGLDLE